MTPVTMSPKTAFVDSKRSRYVTSAASLFQLSDVRVDIQGRLMSNGGEIGMCVCVCMYVCVCEAEEAQGWGGLAIRLGRLGDKHEIAVRQGRSRRGMKKAGLFS